MRAATQKLETSHFSESALHPWMKRLSKHAQTLNKFTQWAQALQTRKIPGSILDVETATMPQCARLKINQGLRFPSAFNNPCRQFTWMGNEMHVAYAHQASGVKFTFQPPWTRSSFPSTGEAYRGVMSHGRDNRSETCIQAKWRACRL